MATYLQEYQKLKLIGKGAFASIWKVRHKDLGYVRAIKVSNEVVEDENDKAYQTFIKECRALLKIGNGCHPNIVRIYQPRLIDNKAIVEMDYVDGCTLNSYLQSTRFMRVDEVKRLVSEIGGALAYCHVDIYRYLMNPAEDDLKVDPDDAGRYVITPEKERELIAKYGVTHNDLHSNNVMRRNYDGGFVLLDFGLAIQDGRSVKSSSRRDGALEYRAPEKWDDDSLITAQSDVYGLGIIFYEALAGRVPFVYDPGKFSSELQSINEIYHAHLEETPPPIEPLRRAAFEATHPGEKWVKDYPDWLEAMVMKCLEKDPAKRYANAKELIEDYNAHLAKDKIPPIPTNIPPQQGPTSNPDDELIISALRTGNNQLRNEVAALRAKLQDFIGCERAAVTTRPIIATRFKWMWVAAFLLLAAISIVDHLACTCSIDYVNSSWNDMLYSQEAQDASEVYLSEVHIILSNAMWAATDSVSVLIGIDILNIIVALLTVWIFIRHHKRKDYDHSKKLNTTLWLLLALCIIGNYIAHYVYYCDICCNIPWKDSYTWYSHMRNLSLTMGEFFFCYTAATVAFAGIMVVLFTKLRKSPSFNEKISFVSILGIFFVTALLSFIAFIPPSVQYKYYEDRALDLVTTEDSATDVDTAVWEEATPVDSVATVAE